MLGMATSRLSISSEYQPGVYKSNSPSHRKLAREVFPSSLVVLEHKFLPYLGWNWSNPSGWFVGCLTRVVFGFHLGALTMDIRAAVASLHKHGTRVSG